MDNAPVSPSKLVLIETGNFTRDISQLVALTRMTDQKLQNLQERTGSTREFTYSVALPGRTRTGITSFNLENPDPEGIFKALKAAGRHVIFLRETQEIAPAFPEDGVPAPGQPYLASVRDWAADEKHAVDPKGFQATAIVTLADGRNTEVYFTAKRDDFIPQNSVILKDGPKGAG